eukprot:4667029-Pleurochrysis_carterae.AAC.1
MIRDLHRPPEGGDRCEAGVARGMMSTYTDEERDIGGGIGQTRKDGEIVGGPANGRRMRHPTREGNRPSFWTYLKESGCRGCQKQGKEETIHHVLSGRCEALGKQTNGSYRTEMRRVLEKCKKLMIDKQINAGVIQQVIKAIRSMEQSGRQMNMDIKEEEELALRQLISGIIPEWREVNEKGKNRR